MAFLIGYINSFTDADMLLDYVVNNNLMTDAYAVNRVNLLRNLEYIINTTADSTSLGQWSERNHMMYNPSIQYRMWQIQQFESTVLICNDIQQLIKLSTELGMTKNGLLQRKLAALDTPSSCSGLSNWTPTNSQTSTQLPPGSRVSGPSSIDPVNALQTSPSTHFIDTTSTPDYTDTTQVLSNQDQTDIVSLDDLLAYADSLPVFTSPRDMFHCIKCPEVFEEKHQLRQHVNKAHKTYYGCKFCTSFFQTPVELIQHTSDIHVAIPPQAVVGINQYGGGVRKKPIKEHSDTSTLSKPTEEKRRKLNDDDDSQNLEELEESTESQDSNIGPNIDAYLIEHRQDKIFKNGVIDHIYDVKFNELWQGENISDILTQLNKMFQHLLTKGREGMADNDLLRIVIQHSCLDGGPIIIPLTTWAKINVEDIMNIIESTQNSKQTISIDSSFEITLGSIELPKGGHSGIPITSTMGHKNSIYKKRSMIEISNKDNMCMSRAIVMAWGKTVHQPDVKFSKRYTTMEEAILCENKMSTKYYKAMWRKKKTLEDNQTLLAKLLCEKVNVSCEVMASLNDIQYFERFLSIQILVVSASLNNRFIYTGEHNPTKIYIYLVGDSHFHAIASITGFFRQSYFCDLCLKPYNCKTKHSCEKTCMVCKRSDCIVLNEINCPDCNMTCRSLDCYENHKIIKPKTKNGLSQCMRYKRCITCYKVVDSKNRAMDKHECGEWLCRHCEQYVIGEHLCYHRASKHEVAQLKHIYFDFETTVVKHQCIKGYHPKIKENCTECVTKLNGNVEDVYCNKCIKCKNCEDTLCGRPVHKVNYGISQSVCDTCKDNCLSNNSKCDDCGTRCTDCDTWDAKNKCFKQLPCQTSCGLRECKFDTGDDFCKFLFTTAHKNFTAIAHNMKGFDGIFLLDYCLNSTLKVTNIIYSGSKIMSMSVGDSLNIRVIDSLNFLPMRLAALPKAFGLKELKKGYFPHFFNLDENQNYVGPYPETHYYGVNFMSASDRDQFLEWHKTKTIQNNIFDFRKEMDEYCRSDVDILRQSCIYFRKLLMDATASDTIVGGIDPFQSLTIASVCMKIYKTLFLEELGLVGVKFNQSPTSVENEILTVECKVKGGKWKIFYNNSWVAETDMLAIFSIDKSTYQFKSSPIATVSHKHKDQFSKVSIQWLKLMEYQHNITIQHALNGGEKKIILDGHHYRLDGFCEKTNTCYEYHGCIYHGCVTCYSENRDLFTNPYTRQSMNELYTITMKKKTLLEESGYNYICIWDHTFQKLLTNPDVLQRVKDFNIFDRLDPRDGFFGGRTNGCKLYHKCGLEEYIKYVDFTSLYPAINKYGVYPKNHPEVITSNFGPLQSYFGFAKIAIIPPRGLYHPVLPYRSQGKLKFPLCSLCADLEFQGKCTHSDSKRTLWGTWCTPEILKAVEKGYIVTQIIEVYHWAETMQFCMETMEGGLFAEYVNTFLKFKQEASGWPEWCTDDEKKTQYIADYFKNESVVLDKESISKNPGLRSLSKLCLNSFWGKFGQRSNLTQTSIIYADEEAKFYDLITDVTKVVSNFNIINENTIHMEWCHADNSVKDNENSNIYIAAFTTCWARLKLYDVLDALDRSVCYYDTDSVVYISTPDVVDPPLGDYLGQLTDELNGEHIVEFVCGGPKNYSFKTNLGNETVKVRGFSLNYCASQLLNFDSVKQLVVTSSDVVIPITNPSKITRDKRKRKIFNRVETKNYRVVYTKRQVLDNFDTIPYGY